MLGRLPAVPRNRASAASARCSWSSSTNRGSRLSRSRVVSATTGSCAIRSSRRCRLRDAPASSMPPGSSGPAFSCTASSCRAITCLEARSLSPSITDTAVDHLADEVGVAVVAGVLLDHVVVDPAQRAGLPTPDPRVVQPSWPAAAVRLASHSACQPPDRSPSRRRRAARARCRRQPGRTRWGRRPGPPAAPAGTSSARPRPCAGPGRATRAWRWDGWPCGRVVESLALDAGG